MSEERWTEQTADLVAREVAKDRAVRWQYTETLDEEDLPGWLADQASDFSTRRGIAVILAALADAGLLVAPGGQSWDQYVVRTPDGREQECCLLAGGTENFVHDRPEKRHTHVCTMREGPWREVSP